MTQSWKHGRWTLAPVAGLDFGATVAGGAGVAQSVEVANAGEFPITVRITSAKAATPVRVRLPFCTLSKGNSHEPY